MDPSQSMQTPAHQTLGRNPRHGALIFPHGNDPDVRDKFRYGPDGGRHFHKSAWRDGEAKRTERTFQAGRPRCSAAAREVKVVFKRALCVACFPLLLLSCDLGYEHFPPHLSYEADFAPSRIVEVEGLVREIAERRGLYLHEKDKSVITSQWHEHERFSMFLFRDEEAFRREREIMWTASLDTNCGSW